MDKDNIYLNMLAETFSGRNSSDDYPEDDKQKYFHFKSFIQIMTTLREIIEKQDELNELIDNIEQKQKSLDEQISKLDDIHALLEKSNESLTSLIANKKAWMKFWEKVIIYTIAISSVFGALALLNQFGVFQIVWNIKK